MTLRGKLSGRSRLYLEACSDWKADWEIVKLMGDTPPMSPRHARPHLGRLIVAGFLTWNSGNNTYCITDEGRAALGNGERVDTVLTGSCRGCGETRQLDRGCLCETCRNGQQEKP
jgi:hypothetical protein